MKTDAFPTITLEIDKAHESSGFSPSVQLDELVTRVLQSILDAGCEIDGCENPDILSEWNGSALNASGQQTHRSTVILFRDGGDWAEVEDGHYDGMGVLFCRRDTDETPSNPVTKHRVHLPVAEEQDRLLALCDSLTGNQTKRGEALKSLSDYLTSIINDQTSWKTFAQIMGELSLGNEGWEL